MRKLKLRKIFLKTETWKSSSQDQISWFVCFQVHNPYSTLTTLTLVRYRDMWVRKRPMCMVVVIRFLIWMPSISLYFFFLSYFRMFIPDLLMQSLNFNTKMKIFQKKLGAMDWDHDIEDSQVILFCHCLMSQFCWDLPVASSGSFLLLVTHQCKLCPLPQNVSHLPPHSVTDCLSYPSGLQCGYDFIRKLFLTCAYALLDCKVFEARAPSESLVPNPMPDT